MELTKKNVYNLPFCQLDDLNNIIIGKYHYNYKTVDFMFNYKENTEKLLIIFHGSIKKEDILPLFLKHNYEKEKISILTISDKLLEYNVENRNTMCMCSTGFMESTDYPLHNIYIEILKKCIEKTNCNKNIFIGPCVGSKPAIYFGSMFHATIIILNGYIYIPQDMISAFEKCAKFNINSIIPYDVEKMATESSPKFIKIYLNKSDNLVFNMNKKFINFCRNNLQNKFETILFDHFGDKDGHYTFFPEGENFDLIIEKI